jgi:hypothetical protein
MSILTCPKCGGSDSFISQRNIVKGRGVYQSGKMRGVAVCRVCDEIMLGSQYAEKPRGKLDALDVTQIILFVILFLIGYVSQISGLWLTILFYVNLLALIIRVVIKKTGHRST